MLELSGSFDIRRISKLLVKHNVKASISTNLITLDGKISEELLEQLCAEASICSAQNWPSETATVAKADAQLSETIPAIGYDLKFSTVHRGEVYLCDFGKPIYHEKAFIRPAIVVQSDSICSTSECTIVIPCTTKGKVVKTDLEGFEDSILLKGDFQLKPSIVKGAEITCVDKRRLRKLIGTMTPEFMNKIQGVIDISLDLTRSNKEDSLK